MDGRDQSDQRAGDDAGNTPASSRPSLSHHTGQHAGPHSVLQLGPLPLAQSSKIILARSPVRRAGPTPTAIPRRARHFQHRCPIPDCPPASARPIAMGLLIPCATPMATSSGTIAARGSRRRSPRSSATPARMMCATLCWTLKTAQPPRCRAAKLPPKHPPRRIQPQLPQADQPRAAILGKIIWRAWTAYRDHALGNLHRRGEIGLPAD